MSKIENSGHRPCSMALDPLNISNLEQLALKGLSKLPDSDFNSFYVGKRIIY